MPSSLQFTSNFHYSQASLQDYNDCQRRFYFRYVRNLTWPAIETEPVLQNERFIQQGNAFHRLVHQYLLGIPIPLLDQQANQAPGGDELQTWWHNFQKYKPVEVDLNTSGQRLPEYSLIFALEGFRIIVRYDLLVLLPAGEVIIYDWKTTRQHPGASRPRADWLKSRWQTRLYPLALVEAGQTIVPNIQFKPEQITMVYWYASYPEQPEIIPYNSEKYQTDRQEIIQIIQDIEKLAQSGDEKAFPLTRNEKHCKFCVYRSLCNRGIRAGGWMEAEIDQSLTESGVDLVELGFDQIGEIEF